MGNLIMLILLSPAKKLLSITKPFSGETTKPQFLNHTADLVEIMKSKSVADISRLMDLSENLAHLNYDRYQKFQFDNIPENLSYPALFLFQGDVYQGLQAKSLSQEEIDFAQNHLVILSGLYGLLKPMDTIQPYRLEMGVPLANPRGSNLYHFWGELLTQHINNELTTHKNSFLVNLASTEYFKVIQEKKLEYPLVTINFYEQKNNQVKMIGVYAKKARGVMARYLIQNNIDTVERIKNFTELGYHFNEQSSSQKHIDFIRVH
jgi:cytoplasmic iron level regulating protein YaaA (DUF328/UPF0246 family)